jgi:hypothetical protein
VTELSLSRCKIAGFLDEVPAHGVAGVMGPVTLDDGQAVHFVEHRVDHPGVETTVAAGVGGCRKKQRRRFPFFKIGGPFFGRIIFDSGYPLPRNLVPLPARSS